MNPEMLLAEIARGQGGVFTRAQARRAGFSRVVVARRVRSGRWLEPRPAVLVTAGTHLGPLARWWAVILSTPGHPVLSHRTAAEVWELPVARVPLVELTTTGSRTPSVAGALLRRRPLPPADVTRRGGVAVTTQERTVLDCLATLDLDAARALLDDAAQLGLLTRDSLRAAVRARAGWAGTAQLRALSLHEDGPRPTWTVYDALHHHLRTAGHRGWVRDVRVVTGRARTVPVALAHPEHRTAVHVVPLRRAEHPSVVTDHNALVVAGWRVLRIPFAAAALDGRDVAAQLAAAAGVAAREGEAGATVADAGPLRRAGDGPAARR